MRVVWFDCGGRYSQCGLSYMYICGSCRGAAVTPAEAQRVGVWQGEPLLDISFPWCSLFGLGYIDFDAFMHMKR